jgi:hypothetical protein
MRVTVKPCARNPWRQAPSVLCGDPEIQRLACLRSMVGRCQFWEATTSWPMSKPGAFTSNHGLRIVAPAGRFVVKWQVTVASFCWLEHPAFLSLSHRV